LSYQRRASSTFDLNFRSAGAFPPTNPNKPLQRKYGSLHINTLGIQLSLAGLDTAARHKSQPHARTLHVVERLRLASMTRFLSGYYIVNLLIVATYPLVRQLAFAPSSTIPSNGRIATLDQLRTWEAQAAFALVAILAFKLWRRRSWDHAAAQALFYAKVRLLVVSGLCAAHAHAHPHPNPSAPCETTTLQPQAVVAMLVFLINPSLLALYCFAFWGERGRDGNGIVATCAWITRADRSTLSAIDSSKASPARTVSLGAHCPKSPLTATLRYHSTNKLSHAAVYALLPQPIINLVESGGWARWRMPGWLWLPCHQNSQMPTYNPASTHP